VTTPEVLLGVARREQCMDGADRFFVAVAGVTFLLILLGVVVSLL
jgi:hypothetical protein